MLYLVPTPIGNLKDITLRALDVLKEVDLVLAEDTRISRKLMTHYGIDTKMSSFHMHNEHRNVDRLVTDLISGMNIALVSDAGTPAISDPGFLLVRAARAADVEVQCLPGATAFVPALVVSGFPSDRFIFDGFLPQKKGRQKRLLALKEEERTIVLYESPHRLLKLLKEIEEHLGRDRRVCVAREISKLYEESLVGTANELNTYFTEKGVKGEFVVLIEGK